MEVNRDEPMTQAYERDRARLFPFAYNVIGDTMEAEDVVQEVLTKHYLFPDASIVNPDGYLIRSVINRAINSKRNLKIRKEKYNGEWLPVPVMTEDHVYHNLDKGRILDYSLLVLLERLSPKERAVFILKESFAYSHGEIGELLGVSEENSRQLHRRGKKKLAELTPVTTEQVDPSPVRRLTEAILAGDLARVKQLLTENIHSVSDGGYQVRAARNIIRGRHDVSRFMMALYDKYFLPGTEVKNTEVNHRPAILFYAEGRIYRCMTFRIIGGCIDAVYIVINPDKLKALQP